MRVAWCSDWHGYAGGAEMTQDEFKAAAPEGVEVIDCSPGEVLRDCDRVVAHNVTQFSAADFDGLENVTWYHHDLSPHIPPETKAVLNANAQHIFCSILQMSRYGREGKVIPPALDLKRLTPPRHIRRGKRTGSVSIAQWRNAGKGPHLIDAHVREHGPIDVYGVGEGIPRGPGVNYKGPLPPDQVPAILWAYERFVFLPMEFEPFCRTVVEAHIAECELIVNRQVGALEYIEGDNLAAIETAAEDFWQAVVGE